MDLVWPSSAQEIERIQRERKQRAVELAISVPFYRNRLKAINLDRIHEPDVWTKIPLLTKDELRQIPADSFHEEFCAAPRREVVEYWRSGGVTGRPLFYPRSEADMKYGILSFQRAFPIIGATAEDAVHISFPLGIHPVGHLYARAAESLGIGTIWCGSGSNTPSLAQLELIQELRPTIWAGMASYALHLANLAEEHGIDLSRSTVRKLIVAAEPLSPAKRQKLERSWGAAVFDHFGMTEAAWVAGESTQQTGLHLWSDLYFAEVVDENTGHPVEHGKVGNLVITPLWTNNVTPFLRWISGDLVSITVPERITNEPWSIFPLMQHARRTVGFFKVRGVNINHNELEDLMFLDASVTDFKAEVYNSESGQDVLRLSIEPTRGVDAEQLNSRLRSEIRTRFQVTPEIILLPHGTIGKEFEGTIKAARFVDKRG